MRSSPMTRQVQKRPHGVSEFLYRRKRFHGAHSICAHGIFLRSSLSDYPEVVDDLVCIRGLLATIEERVLKPEYIMIPEVINEDVLMWANDQMFHTAVDYPDH